MCAHWLTPREGQRRPLASNCAALSTAVTLLLLRQRIDYRCGSRIRTSARLIVCVFISLSRRHSIWPPLSLSLIINLWNTRSLAIAIWWRSCQHTVRVRAFATAAEEAIERCNKLYDQFDPPRVDRYYVVFFLCAWLARVLHNTRTDGRTRSRRARPTHAHAHAHDSDTDKLPAAVSVLWSVFHIQMWQDETESCSAGCRAARGLRRSIHHGWFLSVRVCVCALN